MVPAGGAKGAAKEANGTGKGMDGGRNDRRERASSPSFASLQGTAFLLALCLCAGRSFGGTRAGRSAGPSANFSAPGRVIPKGLPRWLSRAGGSGPER